MIFNILADTVVVLHFAFVVFAIFGGLAALRWPRFVWVHLPTALWAAMIEFTGWYCPLTPLENYFRERGGAAGYEGGFVDHYILPVLYPDGLTRGIQIALGLFVVALNVAIYTLVVWRLQKKSSRRSNQI